MSLMRADGLCVELPIGGMINLTNLSARADQRTSRRRSGRATVKLEWYARIMSGTYQIAMGDRGRLVIPAELRDRAGLTEGTALILLETPNGLVLLTRPQLQDRVRAELAGLDLVDELLAERRTTAAAEDAA